MTEKLLEYFNNDEFPAGVWAGKYQMKDEKGDAKEETPDEVWKDIQNTNYQISNLGRVKNKGSTNILDNRGRYGKRKEKILINRLSENGYFITFLNNLIHRLVAKAFIYNHKDGNKQNNNVDNLEWCTASKNVQHAYNIGLNLGPVGELCSNSKLTEKEIIEIRLKHTNSKITQTELAKEYCVTQQQISRIINNKRWKHIK